MTTTVPAYMLSDSGWAGGNMLINGDMRIDQRNSGSSITVTSASVFCVDRWRAGMSGANGTGQRVASTAQGLPFALQLTGASGTTSAWIGQYIESVNCTPLVGLRVVTSFLAAASAVTSLVVNLKHATAADNFTTTTTIEAQNVTINSTLTRYTVAFTTVLPAGAANGLYLEFVTGTNLGTGTFTVTGVTLEPGDTPSPFRARHYGVELALCQRYHFRASSLPLGVTLNSSDGYSAIVHFPVPMRANPTLDSGASFSVGSGSAGTPSLTGAHPTQARISNSAANWSTDVTVSLTGGFSAELA